MSAKTQGNNSLIKRLDTKDGIVWQASGDFHRDFFHSGGAWYISGTETFNSTLTIAGIRVRRDTDIGSSMYVMDIGCGYGNYNSNTIAPHVGRVNIGNLNVLGAVEASAMTIQSIITTQIETTDPTVIIKSHLSVAGTVKAERFIGQITLDGPIATESTLSVFGEVFFHSNLSVNGATTLNELSVLKIADFKQDVIMRSDLSVAGEVKIMSNLSVHGPTKLNELSVLKIADFKQDVIMRSDLSIAGEVKIMSNLSVHGPTKLNELSVLKIADFKQDVIMRSDLSIAGEVKIMSTLSVHGTSQFDGRITCSNGICHDSDRNLKKNITKIDDALDKLTTINGVRFQWKANNQVQYGIIAQEVQDILPEAVKTINTVPPHLAVDYNSLIGLLIEAVKELNEKVDNLSK